MRDRVIAGARKLGIRRAEVWCGPEFEERLRRDEPLLIRRFVKASRPPRPWTRSGP